MFLYLFEAKSIQSYLSRTSKLRDMTRISDKLDNLIDDSEKSILSIVLDTLGISSNVKSDIKNPDIEFFRCKGGSFYCCSNNKEKITNFKAVWSMVFQQLMPNMAFCDVLEEGQSFHKTMDAAMKKMAASANAPLQSLPIATAICQSYPRTGFAEVLNYIKGKHEDYSCDLATSRNEPNFKVTRDLYTKFLGTQDADESSDEYFSAKSFRDRFQNIQDDEDADRDIALIHLDGNGIGQTLMSLRDTLKNAEPKEYIASMKNFSKALCDITQESVVSAIKKVIKDCAYDNKKEPLLLFRPLVLGGDDVTLLIDARYAADFCLHYCRKFEEISKSKLEEVQKKLESNVKSGTQLSLSASGGILYNKINHPYINSIRLIEELAKKAKAITKYDLKCKKDKNERTLECGASAISIFRMSSTTSEEINEVINRSRVFNVSIDDKETKISTGIGSYKVFDANNTETPTNITQINTLEQILGYVKDCMTAPLRSRYRCMLTELAHHDFAEANKIYYRWIDNEQKQKENLQWYQKVAELPANSGLSKDYEYETTIDDILILYHFMGNTDESRGGNE